MNRIVITLALILGLALPMTLSLTGCYEMGQATGEGAEEVEEGAQDFEEGYEQGKDN